MATYGKLRLTFENQRLSRTNPAVAMEFALGQFVSKLLKKPTEASSALSLAWLKTLSEEDPITALETSVTHLKPFALNDVGTPEPGAELDTLLDIDKQTHKFSSLNERNFLSVTTLPPALGKRIWDAVYYHRHFLSRAYLRCLRVYQTAPETAAVDLAHVAHAVTAALGHLCFLVKWRYVHYQKPPEGMWRSIHELYHLAEQLGLLGDTPMADKSIKDVVLPIYLATLMLDTLSFTGLSKKQIDLAHRWLIAWLKNTPLATQLDQARHQFYVNLDQDRGGRRLRLERFEAAPSNRYWNIGHLMMTLKRATATIQAGGEPAKKLCDACSPSECLAILAHMEKEWALKDYQRQRRRHARQSTLMQASVCCGLWPIYNLLQGLQTAYGDRLASIKGERDMAFEERVAKHRLDQAQDILAQAWHAGDIWTIRNQSDSGFGLSVNEKQAWGLRIGMMVSLVRKESGHDVLIGIIRNIEARGHDEFHIGLETLCKHPQPALAIKITGIPQDTETELLEQELSGTAHMQFGLLLLGNAVSPGASKASLIMPSANYQGHCDYRIILPGKQAWTARLYPVLDQQDEWIHVGIEPLSAQ